MKNKFYNAISVMVAVTIILTGCKPKQEPANPPTLPYVVVIKFIQPEYKNYVLANDFKEDTCFIAMRGPHCEEPTGKTGFSPYWELPDNWLLIDWNWPLFPYAPDNTVALPQQTWDTFTGTMSSPHPKWSRSEPHVRNPIQSIHHIYLPHLEKYSGAHYGSEMVRCLGADDYMCEIPEKMDSIWTILQRDLSIAIENDDLQKLAN